MFTDDDFGPDGLFGSRNITPETADGAFFRYQQDSRAGDLPVAATLQDDRLDHLFARSIADPVIGVHDAPTHLSTIR